MSDSEALSLPGTRYVVEPTWIVAVPPPIRSIVIVSAVFGRDPAGDGSGGDANGRGGQGALAGLRSDDTQDLEVTRRRANQPSAAGGA
jgi:hypothetical protein